MPKTRPFSEFSERVRKEAEAQGPQAVAELEALERHYREECRRIVLYCPICFGQLKDHETLPRVTCPECVSKVNHGMWWEKETIQMFWQGFNKAKEAAEPVLIREIREMLTIGDQDGICPPEEGVVEKKVNEILDQIGPKR